MSWFRKKKKEERNLSFDSLFYNSSGGYATDKAMLLSTVYRCVDVISDSVALLPLEPFKIDSQGYKIKLTNHPSYYVLNKEPNYRMSRFTFIKTLIISTLLRGNGYAYIERDVNGNVKGLHYIDPDRVTITDDTTGLVYNITGFKNQIMDSDIIHILNFSYDGIHGISTLLHAKNTLGLSMDSEAHAAGFFKGGANLAGILTVQSTLSEKQKSDLKSSWLLAFSPSTGTPNGVAVLEGNMDFKPITVSPSDSLLLETRQFNVIDVCRFFGVSPVKAFDLSKSSYSTVEATQLAFLTDTLSPLLEKIELEFERKLFKPNEKFKIDVRFDTSVLLRADKTAEAEYLNKLFQIGSITPNEIRRRLDLPSLDNGDKAFVQVNILTLDNAVTNTINTENEGSKSLQKANKKK